MPDGHRFQKSFFHALRPMAQEKFLLRRRERLCLAYDRAESRGHLQRDQQKDDNPNLEAPAALRTEMFKSSVEEAQAEISRDQPKDQMKRAHCRQRIGRLG